MIWTGDAARAGAVGHALFIGVTLLAMAPRTSLACADLIYPPHLGQGEIASYDVIAVVSVDEITPARQDSRYAAPFKFKGKVARSIKGPYEAGTQIFGETGGPRVGAGCPIELSIGKSYLLFFYGTKNPITRARYGSYYREVRNAVEDGYVKDLEAVIKRQERTK